MILRTSVPTHSSFTAPLPSSRPAATPAGRLLRRSALVLASAACSICAPAFAQDQTVTTPTTPPPVQTAPATSGSPNTPSSPQQRPYTLRSTTRRVVVDVVVTDPRGHAVTGLTQSDFAVSEDSKPQPVRSFEVHTAASDTSYTPPTPPKLPENTFLNLPTAPQRGTPTVILYDALNTAPDAQLYAHQEIVDFIRHRKPGTQIALFVLSDKVHLLQGFTDDPAALSKALAKSKTTTSTSTLLSSAGTNQTSSDSLQPATNQVQSSSGAGSQADPTQVITTLDHMADIEQSAFRDRRIEITLDALTELGRFLAALPGRKNLVWLSSSFPAGILPDSTITVNSHDHDQGTRNYSEEIKEATDLLELSHVAVYPVDARGVTINSVFSASSNKSFSQTTTGYGTAISDFTVSQSLEHSTMDTIAADTGGKAYYNTNNLQDAVDSAMSNGSTYYSLSYAPSNERYDGTLRRIDVKLARAGYTLNYRRTYFADDLNAAARKVDDAPQNALTPALELGTPISHELLVSAHLDLVGDPVPATPKQMELLEQYESMRSLKKSKNGSAEPVLMQRYLIQYGLISRQLDMPANSAGSREASLEFGVISYDGDGRKLNGIDTQVTEAITAPRYALLANEGYHVVQSVIIPVTASSVRLAVRDTHANRVGSLEVQLPLAKIESKPSAPKSPGAASPSN